MVWSMLPLKQFNDKLHVTYIVILIFYAALSNRSHLTKKTHVGLVKRLSLQLAAHYRAEYNEHTFPSQFNINTFLNRKTKLHNSRVNT